MRLFTVRLPLVLAAIASSAFGFAPLAEAQTVEDGPVRVQARVRDFQVLTGPTDIDFFGIVGQPDDLTFRISARDSVDLDGANWTASECLTQDANPPLVSTDFSRAIFDFTYPTEVPLGLDLRLDSWEDDLGSDQLLGIGCAGTRCAYEVDMCCGGTLFGVCIGAIDSDDNRAFGDPMLTGLAYRTGDPCEWYDHGFLDSDCCGDIVRPRVETRWTYEHGFGLADAIDLGVLPEGGTLSHRNSNACYTDAQPEVEGADVSVRMSATGSRVVEVRVCGRDGFAPDVTLWGPLGQADVDNTCTSPAIVELCDGDTLEVAVGSAGAPGAFEITFTDVADGMVDACCGDTHDDRFEQCDDGNDIDTDGCIACTLARCGDGIVHETVEACDDGGLNGTPLHCAADCSGTTPPVCGNGVREAGETCDDGASNGEPLRCAADCAGLSPAECGNTVVELGEACDDGNDVDTDDCLDCVGARCGDGAIWDGVETCDDGVANGTPLACNLSCDGVTLSTCGNAVVELGEACDDGAETETCDPDCTVAECGDGFTNATAGEACDDGVRNGEPLACDTLCEGTAAAVCGNGVLEPGEACDAGGESETCDDDCTPAQCGDGAVNATAGESCDDGGESETCNVDCSEASCGDGVVNDAADEECDDGNDVDTDECFACADAFCGDGVTQDGGETCDDGADNGTPGACNLACDGETPATCGNGVVEGDEACDGAGESADCNADCTDATCGDGILNRTADEVCDDGEDNGAPGGCASDCSGATSAECGNGVIETGELCDDGGESATCDSDCSDAVCGDGVVNATAGEECDGGADCTAACTVFVEDVGPDVSEDVGEDVGIDVGEDVEDDAVLDTRGRLEGGGLSCASGRGGSAPWAIVLLAAVVLVRRRRA